MINARRVLNCVSSILCLAVAACVLVGCQGQGRSCRSGENRLEITLADGDTDEYAGSESVIVRQWVSVGKWNRQDESQPFNLRMIFRNADSLEITERYFSNIDKELLDITWPEYDETENKIQVSFDGKLADLHFTCRSGKPEGYRSNNDVTAFGDVLVDMDSAQIATVKDAFGAGPSVEMLISFAIRNVGADELAEYADCGVKFSLEQVDELVRYNYAVADISKLLDNGYDFNADEVVKLARYRVSSEYAVGWKRHGYDLSADQLVYAKQRYLKSEMAKAWREAGYELSLEKVYWVKQRYLKTESAVAWRKVGYELTLDDLYWIKQRYLKPETAKAWKDASYELTLKELYWVKQRYLKPEKANAWKAADYELDLEQLTWVKQRYIEPKTVLQWRKEGYELSLEDLYKLKTNHVDAAYGAAFADDEYELPTVDELIDFKRARISAETVKKLRKRKNDYDHSRMLKDLHSNSRDAIHRSTMYLSHKRFKDREAQLVEDVTADDILIEMMESPDTLESLKALSKDYQNWLKSQKGEDLNKWIEEYPGYLETRSPYYSD